MPTESRFTLVVPLDASGVTDFKPERALKVAIVGEKGRTVASQVVELDARGQGAAKFGFAEFPGELRVLVGPDDAGDDEIAGLQTLTASVSRRLFDKPLLELPPLKVTDFYWHHWLRWCRWYTVRGRVVCADGSPVPGATVCAFDVDSIFPWVSHQNVGCTTTDASGSFSMTFRWCCGWLPWWWWKLRDWRLDIDVWNRLRPLIEVEPRLPVPPRPTVQPGLEFFSQLLGDPPAGTRPLDPAQLPALRERLVKVLPRVPELEKLHVWPWYPREPWFDCAPDIAFRVTQQCDGVERVIVDEPWWRTRWDIDPTLDVTLVATSDACCVRVPPPVEGNCMVPSSVCGIIVSDIGGNVDAPAAPVGYARPVAVPTPSSDAPWAGTVLLEGQFGAGASVDYYEFEVAQGPLPPMPVWTPVAVGSAGGFARRYFDGATLTFPTANFPFQFIDGRYVVESREHYEATHPGPWGVTRLWTGQHFDTLMPWRTDGHYDNGEYHLRLRGWDLVDGKLVNDRIVPLCTEGDGPPQDNRFVLHLDNRTTGTATDASGDEPRAKVLDVRIAGGRAGPCDVVQVPPGASLEVDFVAYDVDAHLSEYSLVATFGADEPAIDLLAAPGATLTGVALGGAPAAVQVGPTYPAAFAQGAARPHWSGGGLRLHIPDLRSVITRSCCYQIELWVYKRTIVDCNGNRPHRDFSFYSLTIMV